MERIEFNSYDEYIVAQRRADRRKSRRISVSTQEVARIFQWIDTNDGWKPDVVQGICHGARYGDEVAMFRKFYPDVIGTDLFPKEDGVCNVQKWDFNQENSDWKNQFHFLYSNSLDHARDPIKTLEVWLSQLHEEGHLFLSWGRHCMDVRGGDCFGATLEEYITLLDDVGFVDDLIYHPSQKRRGFWVHKGRVVTVVARRK